MTTTTRLAPYFAPEETLAALSGEGPLLCLGGADSRRVLVTMDFEEEPFASLENLALWHQPASERWAPDRVIVASYSDYAHDGGAKSRAFRLKSGWVWDRETEEMWHFSHAEAKAYPPPRAHATICAHAIKLAARNDRYGETARAAIDDIKRGRFYQINLLRYFQVELTAEDGPRFLLPFWGRRAGAFGVFLRMPDLSLISFSPERLVALTSHKEGFTARAEPIKGTVAVGGDPSERIRARAFLAHAPKEKAELAIITDLLRNDLYGIADRHGVRVLERGAPVSAAGVEHFKAVISAECPKDVTFARLAAALLPGGSITGAPKREVMAAIRAYEGRPRDFFMGSVFVLDSREGTLDASILIRTLVRLGKGAWEYAAGSGLTVASDPEAEAAEIVAKCRVIDTP